jgi:stearoyl-CoA desaturase (delta-9 desaturase)
MTTSRDRKPAGALTPIDWPIALGLAALHLGAVAALFQFSWFAVGLGAVLLWLTGSLGISLAFHRMLAHGSFKPRRWLKLVLVAIGCLALQGRPFYWVGVHRLHHADSDGPTDPHTPEHGLWWSHAGWMLRQDTGGERRERAVADLKRDPGLAWLNRYAPLLQLLSFAAIWAIGDLAAAAGVATSGLSCFLWAVGARAVVGYHSTWLVNSASHRWGYVNYPTRNGARNLWWVALVSFGEGWHNNHHAHASSARIGHRWFEIDVSWLALRALAGLRLVQSMNLPRNLTAAKEV